jgi:hypothetical protein
MGIKMKKLFYGLLISILIILVIISIKDLTGKVIEEPMGMKFNEKLPSGKNGAVVNIWLSGEDRINVLRDSEIKYLYVDVGDTTFSGILTTDELEISRFLEMIEKYEEENDHDFVLLPYSEINTYDYDITSEKFQDNFIDDYKRLIEMGFDGIYVDVEPVRLEQIQSYFDLLDSFSDDFVGVYSGSLGNSDSDWAWSENLFKIVDKKADLIFVPGYDTGIESKGEYQEHLENQIEDISKLELDSVLILGIPTHKQDPENIGNALESFNRGEGDFDGVAVFSEWTADEGEWEIFREYF